MYMFDGSRADGHADVPWALGRPQHQSDRRARHRHEARSTRAATGTDLDDARKGIVQPVGITTSSEDEHPRQGLPASARAQNFRNGSFGYDSNVSGVPYSNLRDVGRRLLSHRRRLSVHDGLRQPRKAAQLFVHRRDPHRVHVRREARRSTSAATTTCLFTSPANSSSISAAFTVRSRGASVGDRLAPADSTRWAPSIRSNFFSAERHITGSNIEFTTTLKLSSAPPPK